MLVSRRTDSADALRGISTSTEHIGAAHGTAADGAASVAPYAIANVAATTQ